MSEPTSSHKWEELLADKDIVVVKKATFFRTVNRLFVFARAPGRHTWEFFSYRAWQYIFGTWCATFDLDGSVLSCGAQHPFIFRWVIGDKTTLRYALPDYVLLDHATDPDGEQEDRLVLIVEIKALRIVNPDTQVGRTTAEDIFHKTWKQRLSQAKLAFQCHPTQQEVHIVMIAGPWFALYVYGRSQLMGDAPSGNPEGRSLRDRDSRPRKRWRREEDGAWRGSDDETAQPIDTQKLASATILEDKGEQGRSLRWDRGKRKRSREAEAEHANAPVVAKHVLQLRPSGDSDALNPWFLRLLGQMKQNLEHFSGEFTTQKSWFDCPITASHPSDDGHAEGFVLPAGIPSLEVSSEVEGVDDVERLDEDPVLANVPSTPGNGRETLNAMQLNALLSPKIHRTPRVYAEGGAGGAVPPQSEDAATPKAQHSHPSHGASFQWEDRELSPSDAYLERRQHGSLHPPQFHPAPPDSSPPHFTPQKQLLWFDAAEKSDSESLAGYDASGAAAIPRPTSAPPTLPPPHRSHGLTAVDSTTRVHEPRLPGGRLHQDHVSRSTLPSRSALPSRTNPPLRGVPPSRKFQLAGAARRGAPIRQLTERLGDLNVSSDGLRKTATAGEWHRKLPTKDELLLLALNAPRGADGKQSLKQAYLNAGMTEDQAALACRRYNDVHASKATGGGGSSTAETFTVPPLHIRRRPAIATSSGGAGLGQLARSGGATGPPTTSGGARASGSRPPPVDEASATRTAGRNERDTESESLNDHFLDAAPSPAVVLTPASAPPTPLDSSQASDTPRDFESMDSRDHRAGGGPPIRRTDPSFVLPGPNPDPGPLGTNATRKGKERQS